MTQKMWHSKVLRKTLEGFGRCLVPTWHGRNLANPCPRGLALQSSEGRGGHTLVRAGSCPGGGSGDPQRGAGATVRPVASPTAFVFCYVLWVAGHISALLRRGDLGPEWRGQLSGVTQLRSGKAHTHCTFRDHDDVERPMGWRCGRWEVANRQRWFSPSGNGQRVESSVPESVPSM